MQAGLPLQAKEGQPEQRKFDSFSVGCSHWGSRRSNGRSYATAGSFGSTFNGAVLQKSILLWRKDGVNGNANGVGGGMIADVVAVVLVGRP